MDVWIVLLLVLIILALSIWQRMKYFRTTISENTMIGSPLSLAIQELVAISGGIYLSLMTIVTFLKLNIPGTIILLNVSFDPLAFSAICLAIIQPFFVPILNNSTKK